MKKRKYFIIFVTTLVISSFGCNKHNKAINIADENNIMEEIKTENYNKNNVNFTLMDNNNLSIDSHRLNCDGYSTDRCTKWSQDEIDMILNSIKGDWKIKDYIGFVSYSLYFPELSPDDNITEKRRNHLLKEYKKVVNSAKNKVPNVKFSVKKVRGEEYPNSNMIFVNDTYRSPFDIILSTDYYNDNVPVYIDQTTVSPDLNAKYLVIYIRFLICYGEEMHKHSYEPATLVMTSDKQFYILIDGAFYSLK